MLPATRDQDTAGHRLHGARNAVRAEVSGNYLRRLTSMRAAITATTAPRPAMAHGESTGTDAGVQDGVPAMTGAVMASVAMAVNERKSTWCIGMTPFEDAAGSRELQGSE